MRSARRRQTEKGAVLGIVLILLVVVLLGGALAVVGVQSDTASAGADRLARQLQDCAERGLEWGKQAFTTTYSTWDPYLAANNVCATTSPFPCPPFHAGTGTPPANYPSGAPFTQTITMGGDSTTIAGITFTTGSQTLTYTVGIYDNQESTEGTSQLYNTSADTSVVVYSICKDPTSGQSRSVQSLIRTTTPTNVDYQGQAGFGFRNQGNQNQ